MQSGQQKLKEIRVAIRPFRMDDFPFVTAIYQQGIDTKNATFETKPPDWISWDQKFLKHSRLVATVDNKVVGWAALSAVSYRCVYSGVCELSIYTHTDYQGKGIGRSLMRELITVSEQNNIWTLQAGIFPENMASIKIHQEAGFRRVGFHEKMGKMNGQWRDVILFERRSTLIGID